MLKSTTKPVIGVPANRTQSPESRMVSHSIGENYIAALVRVTDCLAIGLPALGDESDVENTVSCIDGLMLTGGRANIEPHHYGGPPFPDDEIIDPARDSMVLPLIRSCVEAGVPIFGTCRGIQEINVAFGGTLHYRVHEVPGKLDHRMPREGTAEEKMALRHDVALAEDGLFAGLVGAKEVKVNSLHGQGIDKLGDGLEVEAVAPDGIIEGIRAVDAPAFTVGVQWHAEWKVEDHALSRALFAAFGEAARQRARTRVLA